MTPFSRWERELPKLITDGRWSVVGSLKERRLIFDDFCKSSAADHMRQKSGKADGARAARDGFHALLDEASVQGVRMSGTRHSVSPGHRSTFTSPLCLTGCERHALQYHSMYPWAAQDHRCALARQNVVIKAACICQEDLSAM